MKDDRKKRRVVRKEGEKKVSKKGKPGKFVLSGG